MFKKMTLMMTAVGLLSGCVSDSDFTALQSQVNRLNAKLSTTENQLQSLQQELTVVKGQRVVRLPTGAPMAKRQRNTQQPDYAVSEEQRLFNAALASYKGGNIQSAIQQFGQFSQQYPNDKNYADALYYLGEANYTIRDYQQAQQVLETLVYQTPSTQLNPNAMVLLEKVYRARGESTKLNELKRFRQNLNNSGEGSIL